MSEGSFMRSPIGEMRPFDDGVIVHTPDEGALVDEHLAAGVLEATRTLAGGRPVSVVVDLRRVAFADQASRAGEAAATDVRVREPRRGTGVGRRAVAYPRRIVK